jgi:hypothetical protein
MSDKIVNFIAADDGPVDKGVLIKNLQRLPNDITREYIGVVYDYLEYITAIKNIIESRDKPHLVRHYIDGLTEEQLDNINKLVLSLSSVAPERMIKEILQLSFGIVTPSEETMAKAIELIKSIKVLDNEGKAERLLKFWKYLNMITDAIITTRFGEEFEAVALVPLATLPENDLDKLTEIACSKIFFDYNA